MLKYNGQILGNFMKMRYKWKCILFRFAVFMATKQFCYDDCLGDDTLKSVNPPPTFVRTLFLPLSETTTKTEAEGAGFSKVLIMASHTRKEKYLEEDSFRRL
jgi:hypothetical protein